MDQYLLINTIFRGMNIHLPAILMWTEGVQGFDPSPFRKFHEIFPSDVTIFFRPKFRGSFGHDAHHDP